MEIKINGVALTVDDRAFITITATDLVDSIEIRVAEALAILLKDVRKTDE